jgi:hypothetical protein
MEKVGSQVEAECKSLQDEVMISLFMERGLIVRKGQRQTRISCSSPVYK